MLFILLETEEEAVENFFLPSTESALYGRKALRSPSLRLRFGRTDPYITTNLEDMETMFEKRSPWIGEVNQKPIRSPSLRLRFGRRSDPSFDLISKLSSILNEIYKASSGSRKPLETNDLKKNLNMVI